MTPATPGEAPILIRRRAGAEADASPVPSPHSKRPRPSDIPLSLYVHLPWCVKKCPYCDFNSHKAPAATPEREYVDALLADARTLPPRVWGRRISSVFIGGGTPSLFSPRSIDDLLRSLRTLSLLSLDCEVTLEANPESADAGKLAEFAAAGVNRLSLGVQSFDSQALAALGRAHDGRTARAAAEATAASFDNFNIDLMHALPGQNAAGAAADVAAALSFGPSHLSLYQLTMEPGTPFFLRPPAGLPESDEAADIGDAAFGATEQAGFERYEISAFALPGRQCLHNLEGWLFGDYAAIGAGAHSKITGETIEREERTRHPAEYMRHALAGDAVARRRAVSGRDAAFEFMLNALRLPGGFAPALLEERAGESIASVADILSSCERDGLLEAGIARIRPTAKGLRYLNDMLTRFLPEEGSDS